MSVAEEDDDWPDPLPLWHPGFVPEVWPDAQVVSFDLAAGDALRFPLTAS